MTFKPNSTIYLCNVPFDNTYKHVVFPVNRERQAAYFAARVQKTFTDYLTVRRTSADGSTVNSVKVDANIDDLYNCNYMYYRNENHGTRLFYAFIKQLVYVNEGTTEIIFECDVFQTWYFDITFKPSFVVREHSLTDYIGENVTPENFALSDFHYAYIKNQPITVGDGWGYIVATTELLDDRRMGKTFSGIASGVHLYYFPEDKSPTDMTDFIDFIQKKYGECVVNVSVIPLACLDGAAMTEIVKEDNGAYVFGDPPNTTDFKTKQGYIGSTHEPAHKQANFTLSYDSYPFVNMNKGDSYRPKNNKLYTFPFYSLYATNNLGQSVEYVLEDFKRATDVNPLNKREVPLTFDVYGDISVNPSVMVIPMDYKETPINIDYAMTLKEFPQIAVNTDTYKLWLAKNQFGQGFSMLSALAQIAGGVVASTTGVGAMVGAPMIASGITGAVNTINEGHKARMNANTVKGGDTSSNLITAMGKNNVQFYVKKIKADQARIIDDFFTMYGYQVNRVKMPNLGSRPYFNYVQTMDCNIIGGIPDDDMRQFKAIFNGGVTLWDMNAVVGDYSVDNSPTA